MYIELFNLSLGGLDGLWGFSLLTLQPNFGFGGSLFAIGWVKGEGFHFELFYWDWIKDVFNKEK
jgi:hypothetical protein